MNVIYLLALINRQEREQDYLNRHFCIFCKVLLLLLCTRFYCSWDGKAAVM